MIITQLVRISGSLNVLLIGSRLSNFKLKLIPDSLNSYDLQKRCKNLALQVIIVVQSLPKTLEAQILGRQVLRSVTSVAANYRAACRARSRNEFASKISIVVEEADETILWLEMIQESGIAGVEESIRQEAHEILYIMSASRRTVKSRDDDK